MSVSNPSVIEYAGGIFVLSLLLFDFSVGIGAFVIVIVLSQISSVFSFHILLHHLGGCRYST